MDRLAPWTLVTTEAPVGQLVGHALVLSTLRSDEAEVFVVTVAPPKNRLLSRKGAGPMRLTYSRLGAPGRPRRASAPEWLRLDDLVKERLGGGGLVEALVVPGVRWGTRSLFGGATTTAVTKAGEPAGTFEASQIRARLRSIATPSHDDHSPDAARARVDRVRDTFGALSSHVLYRIEQSALFDPSVPLTRQYHLQLLRWADEQAHLGAADLDRLSREVELAFDTARAHAETVGLTHLPSTSRDTARRAAKAALLAGRAASEGERAAAQQQVQRLLEDLAIHYLPAPSDVPRMIGGSPSQLQA